MPNYLSAMRRRISLLAALVVGLLASPVFAEETKRVRVDIGPIDDDLSRAAQTRLSAELTAAGFELTTSENAADVQATLVARDGQLVVYLELPDGVTTVVRADDVGESEAPEVLAVRAVERIRAGLANPSVAPVAPIVPPTNHSNGAKPNSELPRKPQNKTIPHPARSVFPRHMLVGGLVSLDGGAFSIAPTIGLGMGLGRHFFIRSSFWGPSTRTTIQSASGQAKVWSLGGRLDAGGAFLIRSGTTLGIGAGIGIGRYAIAGQASPGFTPRETAQPVFLGALDAFFLQALAGRFYLDVDVGVSLALPSVVIRIDRRDAGERGFPEMHARIGLAFAL